MEFQFYNRTNLIFQKNENFMLPDRCSVKESGRDCVKGNPDDVFIQID